MRIVPLFCVFSVLLLACGPALPEAVEQAMAEIPQEIDFNLHVKPILSDRCFACHGPDKAKQKANLRLDLPEGAFAELSESPGLFAIVPGKVDKSQVFHRIVEEDPEVQMPPPDSKLSLTDQEKAILIRWIEAGAEYKPHWSLLKPQKPVPPALRDPVGSSNPIDQFVRATLQRKGWKPNLEAEKEILLRRLSLDLTGLPPTVAETEAFLTDPTPDAYEKAVDRLLASPHYGERLAVDWLDLARFADTHGYTVDRFRDMSPWRDWVIQAFNRNMPYDHFVTWQMAGDLFPGATREQILATGFNRNHAQNMEGGIVPEEFRVEYVMDRTNTLGTAFLGLTVECARCHDHKYDPISQKEYYQLYSFFNNVNEAGQISYDDSPAVPTILLTDAELDAKLAFLQGQIAEQEKQVAGIPAEEKGFEHWLQQERFRKSVNERPNQALAYYDLERLPVRNLLNPQESGTMKQQHSPESTPILTMGKVGSGVALNGDAWLDLGEVGAFGRADRFSVGAWFWIPHQLSDGVIFHKGEGAALYNFRGYHLALKDNRLEMLMARTTPDNAITEYVDSLPRDQWVHLLMTYDGSSAAAGLRLYLNGREVETEVDTDHLYKDILFPGRKQQPGLQIGARWRGKGIKGATVDEICVYDRELTAMEVLQLADKETFRRVIQKPGNQLTTEETHQLRAYYLAQHSPAYRQSVAQLQQLRANYFTATDTVKELMVMNEMSRPRQAYVLDRGQYDAHTEAVFPATPTSILAMPADLPPNRLGLAQWLFHPDHPLTARVTVNRYWQLIFGQGLVKTSDDFGNQGELPSHPELLDWLAIAFIESGWDVKALLKMMVMSASYRQSSRTAPEQVAIDPENRFLARGPSERLTSEMIRDQALAASGLLVRKIGGPSVKPYQPEGLWRVNGGRYEPDQGEGLYRRSLYTFWKRSVPPPTQGTFDAPTRSSCTVKRQKTSTPLQALVLLNDPTFVEAARVMGVQIARAETPADGIRRAFCSVTGRFPASNELDLLVRILAEEKAQFVLHPEKQEGWLQTGASPLSADIDPPTLAAAAVVASTLLNADASLVKR